MSPTAPPARGAAWISPSRGERLVAALLRNFVVYNPLFLFSAALVLGAAWLLNPPDPAGGRDLAPLAKLWSAIQLYQLSLLAAAALLARSGLVRDVRSLALVLAPFLADVTFTQAALAGSVSRSAGWSAGGGVALGGFLLSALQADLARRLAGWRPSRLGWAALLAGPALIVSFPLLASAAAYRGLHPGAPFLGGAALGLLALALTRASASEGPGYRRLALLPLLTAALHLGATSWAHAADLRLLAAPLCVALGLGLPRLAWPSWAARDAVSPVVLPALGVLLAGRAGGEVLGASTWSLTLLAATAVAGHACLRLKSPFALAGALTGLHLLWGGTTAGASLASVGHNPVEPLGLLVLYGFELHRRGGPVTALPPLALAAALVYRLGLLGAELDEVLALDLLGGGVLLWTHRVHGRGAPGARWRLLGASLLWAPAALLALHPASPAPPAVRWWGLGGIACLLALYGVTRLRTYALPALLLPTAGAARLAPTTAAGWGLVGFGLAFPLVALGVLVSLRRERLLGWLARDARDAGRCDTGATFPAPPAPLR